MTDKLSKAAAELGRKGGKAGKGASKVRGDSAYYRLKRFRGVAAQHQAADAACGRDWVCACAACKTVRERESAPEKSETDPESAD